MSERRTWVGYACQALVVAAAAGAAVVRVPAGMVEHLYSNSAYAFVQPVITSLSNRTRYALLDGVIIAVLALWSVQAVRELMCKQRVLAKIARILVRTIVWCAALYLTFVGTWGLNYRRQSLVEKLTFRADTVTADAARDMAEASVA